MALFVGVVFLTYREEVLGSILAPFTVLTARTTLGALQWLGVNAAREATTISHSGGFAYEVYYRCTGVLPVAFLTVMILAYPAHMRLKLIGFAIGIPILLSVNLIRLVHLFYIGVNHRALFDIAHLVVWEGLIIVAIVGIWLGWTILADSTAGVTRKPACRADETSRLSGVTR
jgi:exosortase H (IPTLxxWG-CTERM-specific)